MLFKSAGGYKSCTHLINSIGPIKCKEFALSFNLNISNMNNNLKRDIFIVDSEGINLIDAEKPWLKKALISMFPINTISFYVSKSMNSIDFDQFIKYIKLVHVIGGMAIQHGIGYITNQVTLDEHDVINQLLQQNRNSTKDAIEEFSKISKNINESNFKCMSVLSFDRHKNDFLASVKEVAKFILNICLYEKALITGEIMVKMLETFASKTNNIFDLSTSNENFEAIFNDIVINLDEFSF